MTLADRIAALLMRYGPLADFEIALALSAPTADVRDTIRRDPRFLLSPLVGNVNVNGVELRRAA